MLLPVNTIELTEIVNNCFMASMSGQFDPGQRGTFLAIGTQLREYLRKVIGRNFDEAINAFQQANALIKEVNADLKIAIQDLADVANTVQLLGRLVGVLDELIKAAAVFL